MTQADITLLIEQMETLPIGTVIQKGTKKRIFLGIDKHFVSYQVPSFESKSQDFTYTFAKWFKGAEIVR